MGRGSSKSGGRRGGGGGGLNPADILSTRDLVSEREGNRQAVDEVLSTAREIEAAFGVDINQFQVAVLKAKAQDTLAYYDNAGNIAVNETYFDTGTMNRVYAESVRQGFHPSSGDKTGIEAVMAHEFGHYLTDIAADRMGIKSINKLHEAAKIIAEEGRKISGDRGVVIAASKISGYAQKNNAEAVAEAVADVYCNGRNAKKQSSAIVTALIRNLNRGR